MATHDCLQFKLLGVIAHGQGVFLNLVPPFIPDTANLNATVLLQTFKQIADIRNSRGLGNTLPHRLHIQWDGDSSNVCKTSIAFNNFLVMDRIFKEVASDRHPVGKQFKAASRVTPRSMFLTVTSSLMH